MDPKPVSKFSATMIGAADSSSDRHYEARELYKREAQDISKALESNHYSRRLKNMQVYYPETITKLNHAPAAPTYHPPPVNHGKSTTTSMREQEFYREKNEQTFKEHDLNSCKLLYNKEVGRKAQVSKIIAGKAPATKEMLFPQGANHQQILALTGTAKMPDPRIIPPRIQRPKKWLGDDQGWSN